MGILYNSFTPEPPPFLIPYSNRSDIVTYLTPDNFQGSSSTSWGTEYPKPMVRADGGVWSLNSDNSVRLEKQYYLSFNIDMTGVSTRFYTVYMAVKYNIDDVTYSHPCLQIERPITKQENFYINRVSGTGIDVRFGSTSVSYLTPASPAFGNYHVYAFRQQYDGTARGVFHHVVDDGNLVNIYPSTPRVATTPTGFKFYSQREDSVDVKFLCIVMGASGESDSTVLNNVSNIMTTLNIS